MGVFEENPQVQFVTIGHEYLATDVEFQFWVDVYSWGGFPVIYDDNSIVHNKYQALKDTFLIVDQEGVVRYKKYGNNTVGVTFPQVIEKINELLAVPVSRTTWGRVKSLYQ